jgi:hypothetical protein
VSALRIEAPAAAPPDLRERLAAMRESLAAGLSCAPHIDGGHLALLGHVGTALSALDAIQPDGDAAPASRVVVIDDGETLRLTLYDGRGQVAAMALDPRRCVQLAGDLIRAAGRRM